MRQRNKPWADEMIAANRQWLIADPEAHKGRWHQIFANSYPIHIEIGTGKGQFIIGMAKANPEINYIGIELSKKVIVSALEKLVAEECPNVRLLHVNASDLPTYFEKGEIARIYLNFSDPWPKLRHEKRRLTHHNFLKIYQSLFKETGEIHFKTDNRGLFEYSLISFTSFKMALNQVSLDLHSSDFEGNIMTEYEKKFSAKGNPIYRCEIGWSNE